MRRLENRIGRDGVLRVISQQTRSQVENKELAVERFAELLRDALKQLFMSLRYTLFEPFSGFSAPLRWSPFGTGSNKKEDAGQQGGEAAEVGGKEAAKHVKEGEVAKSPRRGLRRKETCRCWSALGISHNARPRPHCVKSFLNTRLIPAHTSTYPCNKISASLSIFR